jgi:hypothetical protein
VYFSLALLWYSSFILDAQALVSGTLACRSNFEGTDFAEILDSGLVSIDCAPTRVFTITPFIDVCIAFASLLLSQAWFHCTDLYDSQGHTGFNVGPEFRPSETMSDIRSSLAALPWWEEGGKKTSKVTDAYISKSKHITANPITQSQATASSETVDTHVVSVSQQSSEPAWTKE